LVKMSREAYHPNAYLSNIKNNRLGLRARTHILNLLDKVSVDAKTISKEVGMHYGVVMHHLRLLKAEALVARKPGKPYIWVVTGLGQKRLVNLG
jgi:DNA-binding transcriptional ArsR family regulator